MSSSAHRTIVVGKGGSGKSTFAQSLGWTLDLDRVIREEFGSDFGLYRRCTGEREIAQKAFCARIRQLLPYVDVIEGSVRDYDLIRAIFAGYTWRLIFVIPSSDEVYAAFVLKRFMEEPGYARIGWLAEGDPEGKMLKLKTGGMLKSGVSHNSLETITAWVRGLAKIQYTNCQQLAAEYAAEFPDNMSVHVSK